MTEESKDEKKMEMPPYPDGVLEWTDDQKKNWKFEGDMEDIHKRSSFKLWNCWLVWVNIRNNEKLIEIIGKNVEDKESDEFYLKQIVVALLDQLGKVLGQTNITEEIFKLNNMK